MTIPDYVSPIVAYRVWRWDAAGLRSLNGEPWPPGRPLAAGCRASVRGTMVGRAAHDARESPRPACTCGVYAAKSLDHPRKIGYDRYGIRGEVSLWGPVVEHDLGWRAQYAWLCRRVLRLSPIAGLDSLPAPHMTSVTDARDNAKKYLRKPATRNITEDSNTTIVTRNKCSAAIRWDSGRIVPRELF
jgi:hypothetical protein